MYGFFYSNRCTSCTVQHRLTSYPEAFTSLCTLRFELTVQEANDRRTLGLNIKKRAELVCSIQVKENELSSEWLRHH